MCEKNHVDSSRVLSFMSNAGVVTDQLTNKKAHLVVLIKPCLECPSWCHGFIMNGRWFGLSHDELESYRGDICNFTNSEYIPG